MPAYELMVLFKQLVDKPQLAANVKRVTESLLTNGTVVRSIENYGERKLANKLTGHSEAHYFIFRINTNSDNVKQLTDLLKLDQDLIRCGFYRMPEFNEKPNFDCVDPLWHEKSPFKRY